MFTRLILCVSPNRLVVGRWHFGKCIACEVFGTDAEGRDAFRRYIQQHPRSPVYLIADAAEEDYRIDTAPHATGAARREMLTRRLGQAYRNIQYRTAQFVGRTQGQRKDDRFLLMALNNADSIAPWVSILEEQHAPLAGIYLLPMASQLLLDSLKMKAPDVLLISRQHMGLRQSYFQNSKLCISRLSPMPDMDADDGRLAELLISEIHKTRAYLSRQRLIRHDTLLKLVVLGMRKDIYRQLAAAQHGIESVAIDSSEVSKRFGLPPSALELFPEILHMQALAHRVPEANLASAAQTKTYFLQRWRNRTHLASITALLCGLILSDYYWIQARDNDSQRILAAEQTARQTANYEQVAKSFPKTPFSGDELRTVVDMAKKLAESAKTPQQLMQVVSVALDGMPAIQLNSLRWKLADDLNAKDDDKDTQTAVSASSTPAQAIGNGGLHEIGFVSGEIRNFHGDYRAAVESVAHLADLLRKNKAVEQVVIVNQPINASTLTTLQGSTREGQAQQSAAALFKLKIVLKQEPRA
ncbi:MAG: hypothetical protein D4R48_03925 [Nitrosomonadales bacterium]|nr:MAG: hypothetical protein D4R48_03925 [Nitrosomonadales bacterium]